MCFSSYFEIVVDFVGPEGGEGTEKARFSDDFWKTCKVWCVTVFLIRKKTVISSYLPKQIFCLVLSGKVTLGKIK